MVYGCSSRNKLLLEDKIKWMGKDSLRIVKIKIDKARRGFGQGARSILAVKGRMVLEFIFLVHYNHHFSRDL